MSQCLSQSSQFLDRVDFADNEVKRSTNTVNFYHNQVEFHYNEIDSYDNQVDSGDAHNTFFESTILKQTACHTVMQ